LKVVKLAGKELIYDIAPTYVGPPSTRLVEAGNVSSGDVKLNLGVLEPGSYLLTLEYFSEVGVRAVIRDQPFVIPKPVLPPWWVTGSPWHPPSEEDE